MNYKKIFLIILWICILGLLYSKILNIQEISNDTSESVFIQGGIFIPKAMEDTDFSFLISDMQVDKNLVSVARFRKFIEDAHYTTTVESYGGYYQDLYGYEWSDTRSVPWIHSRDINWEIPVPGYKALENHPVTQVSFEDAQSYCDFYWKRLLVEFEWEYIAQNMWKTDAIYTWGTESVDQPINTWQPWEEWKVRSDFDGYLYTSPIGKNTNMIGVEDLVANVWEWTDTIYLPNRFDVNIGNIQYEPWEKVLKGWSFACNPKSCHGYAIPRRTHMPSDLSAYHSGFRCTKDI